MKRSLQRQSSTGSTEWVYFIPGVVKLLFETPSGFAIFTLAESYLKKDIEHIWTYFIGNFYCHNVVLLNEFKKFEDRPNAINLATREINPSLNKMILKHINFNEKLAVGRPEYKEIIEESTELSCLYNDNVMEVMWGIQNLLRTLLPQEQSEMTMDEWIPMSKGLDMVLRRHGFVVEPKMINEDIIKTANAMYDIDLRERVHSKFLHNLLGEEFMAISGVDIEDWSLLKLATVAKKMCYPDEGILVGDPYEMFSRREAEMIEDDADKYRDKMDKNTIKTIYRDIVFLGLDKRKVRYKLRCLVREAKEALEAEEVPEEPATTGVNSKQQVEHTVDPPEVPNQSNIGDGQHSITDGKDLEKEDENTSVKQAGLTPDGKNTVDDEIPIVKPGKTELEKIKEENIPETEDETPDGKYLQKEDENTSVKQAGLTPDGKNTVDDEIPIVKPGKAELKIEEENISEREDETPGGDGARAVIVGKKPSVSLRSLFDLDTASLPPVPPHNNFEVSLPDTTFVRIIRLSKRLSVSSFFP